MELFKLFGKVVIDNAEAVENIQDVGEEAERSSGKLSKFLGGVAKVGAGIVAGATAFVSALTSVTEGTREYRNEMAKLDTAFVTNGHTSKAAKNTYMELNAVLGDTGQAVEASNHLSMLCQTEQELAEWTDICTGVYATFGASLPIEGLTEAANETAKVGQLTGPLADALNWAGVSEDEFNAKLAACTSEQERQALITSTLTELYSDASDKYKETNKDVLEANKAQARMTDTIAKFGKIAEPVVTKFKTAAADIMEKLLPVGEMVANKLVPPLMEIVPVIMQLAEALLPVLVELMAQMLPLFVQIIEQVLPPLLDVLQLLLPPLMEIVTVLLPPISSLISNIMSILGPFISEIARLTKDGLGALIPVIEYLAVILSSSLSNAFSALQPIIDAVITVFGGLIDFISGIFTGNWEQAWNGIVNIFKGIINIIPSALEAVINGAIGLINGMIDGINSISGAVGIPAIGRIPTITIPKLEEGGVLEKGQVGILEGTGAEAVVPLDQNKAWISRVAADMNSAVGGGQEMKELKDAFDSFVDELPEMLIEAFTKMKFDVNNREFARLVKAVN